MNIWHIFGHYASSIVINAQVLWWQGVALHSVVGMLLYLMSFVIVLVRYPCVLPFVIVISDRLFLVVPYLSIASDLLHFE